MPHNTPKILIISSDTGGGHRSAAQALVEGINRVWEGDSKVVRVVKAVEDSHRFTQKGVTIYNWILRNKQPWMKYFYWFVNRYRPETRNFFLNRCLIYLKEQFEKWCPHIIVSVHPMTQHIFARLLKELNLADQIPLVTVVTDPCYGFWKGWACNDVSLYLVANDEARQQLIDYGIDSGKIKISGMPIHPKFHEISKEEVRIVRESYDLHAEKFTIFVNAGWIGGGNIPQIFRELVRGKLDVQAIFLAGNNKKLKKEAQELAKTCAFPIKIIGYSYEIEKLMQSADIMISKLGGLTTFEALACRLPIIADATTTPMPQEAGTFNLISSHGAGILLKKASDIVPTLQNLISDSKRYTEMKAATINLGVPNSTEMIIKEIAALLPQKNSNLIESLHVNTIK